MAYPQKNKIVLSGREAEKIRLRKFLFSKESELISIIGRRRVGKTFLVKKVYEQEMIFLLTGIKDANKSKQLLNFSIAMDNVYNRTIRMIPPKNWIEAFEILKKYIIQHKSKKKKVIFLDEFPWLASPRSGFLQAFDHFWNSWAVDHNIIVVICGSAATWMIKKIVNSKGGLHNRVTTKINLEPFTLKETEEFFQDRKINLPRYDIINLYMALGGIPFYLRDVQKGESVIQAIDRICFGKKATLYNEFDNLYKSLFTNYEDHIKIIRLLADKRKGLTRREIIYKTSFSTGGGLTMVLRELTESAFINSYSPYGKKERDKLYRLTDEYSLFYLTFIHKRKGGEGTWLKKALSPSVKSWQGFTFESICFKHIVSIKKALGIEGVYTEESSYTHYKSEDLPGFQIDMLIDRADNSINICEAKYYNTEFILSKEEAKKIRSRKAMFIMASKTKKQIISTLITTYGVTSYNQEPGVDKVLDMEALFL